MIHKIGQTGHQNLKFWNIISIFSTFCTFWPISDPLTNYKGQKSIQRPKLHGKSVFRLNIIHQIGQTGHPNFKFWNFFF